MPTTVRAVNLNTVKPWDNFKHVAQKTSSPPAKIKYNHAIKITSLVLMF